MKKIIKNNIKLIIGFILGIILVSSVYAATIYYNGENVEYDNTTSGFKDSNGNDVEDVQTALDELYIKANKWLNPSYIDFNTLAISPTYTILASSESVCIKRNNIISCFRKNNYNSEKIHLQEVFLDGNCSERQSYGSTEYYCSASDYDCTISSTGSVYCHDWNEDSYCELYSNGSTQCD